MDGLMSREEFNKIVDNFTKILYKSYSLKRSIDNRGLTIHSKILFLLGFILLIIGFALFYWGVLKRLGEVKVVGYCILVLSICVAGSPFIKYLYSRVTNFPTLEEIVIK
jgi:uncharacterized membrane protein